MKEDFRQFTGTVEIDETLIGGKRRKKRNKVGYNGQENKTTVFGMLERNGMIKSVVVSRRGQKSLFPIIEESVMKESMIYSDDYAPYRKLPSFGYSHRIVRHSKYKWADGDVSTNGIEAYWSMIKKSFHGNHRHVSRKHLQKYLNETDFKYNRRKCGTTKVFDDILKRLVST